MELVGGVASASQLTNYFFGSIASFLDVYQKVKSRPEQLRRRLEQINRLGSTVQDIQSSKALGNTSVLEQLKILGRSVQALKEALEKLLGRQNKAFIKRFWATWLKDTDNRRLEDLLSSIEAEKTSLLLSIQLNLQREFCASTHESAPLGDTMSGRRLQPLDPVKTSKLVKNKMPKSTERFEDTEQQLEFELREEAGFDRGAGNRAAQGTYRNDVAEPAEDKKQLAREGATFLLEDFKAIERAKNTFGSACAEHTFEIRQFELGGDSSNIFGTPKCWLDRDAAQDASVPVKNRSTRK